MIGFSTGKQALAESGEDLLDRRERAVFDAKVLSGGFKAAATSADARGRARRHSSNTAVAAGTTRRAAGLAATSGPGEGSVGEAEWDDNERFFYDGKGPKGDARLWNETFEGGPPEDASGSGGSDDERVGEGEGIAARRAVWDVSGGDADVGVEDR